jgi:cobyrinic acid a,c-diamide synthase
MRSRYPRLIIAGLRGGSGKSTLSLGIIAAWRKTGLSVISYKKGPDYIDAGWLSAAAGKPCYNLDPFLVGRNKILSSFMKHYGNADCAVIEGNRGIYDGMDAAGTYSTAELAKILKSPVILIMDCTKMTRTAGALILGIQKFNRKIDIQGVVLNQIAGRRHEKVVSESIARYCGIPVLGAIPKLKTELLSERHIGLTPFQEHPEVEETISSTAGIAEKYLDLEKILSIAKKAVPLEAGRQGRNSYSRITHSSSPRIGIIRDSAFQFYYPENFEELEKRGAEIIEISALQEKELPEIDALYIGGGFPETHAIALAENRVFRKSVNKAVQDGLPVYAECGGLMYLGKALVLDRKTYPMAGVFPVTFSLESRPQAHGYTIIKANRKSPFYKTGTVLKGHEFHYSRVVKIDHKDGLHFAFKMNRGEGIAEKKEGLCYRNAFATYTHLHALGSPAWADGLVRKAKEYSRKRRG